MTQGPDLSRIGAKLGRAGNPNGPKWLYTWLRNPSTYHPRTLMPNMFLDPIKGADGKLTDPAADIAAFLLGSRQDWKPTDVPARELDEARSEALDAWRWSICKTAFTRAARPKQYLKTGIPESRRGELKGDEVELVGDDDRPKRSCATSAAARSASTAAPAATTFPASKTPSRSAPAWPTGPARRPTSWPSSRSSST